MSRRGVRMSDSKSSVMERLGLSGSAGESIYKKLLEEGAYGRDNLSQNPNNLLEQLRGNPAYPMPYRWDYLQETAKHAEVLRMVRDASPETQHYYRLGRHMEGNNEENWVARWFLWHAFRYRDNRPNDNKPRVEVPTMQQGYAATPAGYNNRYWDAARGGYR